MLKEIAKTRGDDLPGYSELVFEPAAFHGRALASEIRSHFGLCIDGKEEEGDA